MLRPLLKDEFHLLLLVVVLGFCIHSKAIIINNREKNGFYPIYYTLHFDTRDFSEWCYFSRISDLR